MHTSCHTMVPHLLERKGSYYYNRRVPQHAVEAFGPTVRIKLSQDRVEASELAKALSTKLDQAWSSGSLKRSVDVKALLEAVRPRPVLLSDWVTEYVELKGIDPTPPNVAVDTLVSIVGDKEALAFTREDARAFVAYLRTKGNSTGTVRRRVNSIAAVISYAQRELDVMQQNPFSRLHIQGEGKDRQKRLTFTVEELRQGSSLAISGGSRLALLFPVLAETGCRLGEVVGLRLQDIDLEQELIRITPHSARSLKTSGSDRELPLVGAALVAMRILVNGCPDDTFLFSTYLKDGKLQVTHASNALNKWIRKRFEDRTAHCLRHTFRDRLRAVECPLEMLDALGGWSSIGTAGSRYGRGYRVEHKREWLEKIVLHGVSAAENC